MRWRQRLSLFVFTGLAWLVTQPARAEVRVPAVISGGMVLQRGMPVPIWGTADANETVAVRLKDLEVSTTADQDGKWRVDFPKLEAGGPHEVIITGKRNTLVFKDILVGEVWVCSGQSNMEWPLLRTVGGEDAIANSANSKIRLFTVAHKTADRPQNDVVGSWKDCRPSTVRNFSAVAYYFGRDLQRALNVPVGLIHTSWGGTRAEAWTSRSTLAAWPELKEALQPPEQVFLNYAKALERYQQSAAEARAAGQRPRPAPVNPLNDPNAPSALYNGMIAPLIPYAIQGVIWYQGESNAGNTDKATQYETLFSAMIRNWREDWKEGDFPFLFVQLAPFMKIDKEPKDTGWARLRESQRQVSLKVARTAMAVITDVGEENDIHPQKKEPVGHRLALAALAIAHGHKNALPSPIFAGMSVEGNKALLSFKGDGLAVQNPPLQGFTIAGEDHVFVPAEATIEGDKVVVWSDRVSKPVAVRYGWANYPLGNLWSKGGLPVSPFRTDDWPPEATRQ
jgi:sialate O-acetylesterase